MSSRRDEEREDCHLLWGQERGKGMQGEMRKESAAAETLTKSSPKHLSIKFLGCLLGFADLRV